MASSSPSYWHILCFLLCLFSVIALSSSEPSAITLSLSPLFKNHSSDPFQNLKLAAIASLTRARHLKNGRLSNFSSSLIKTAVYPKSYGDYSIDLKFGTPPQKSSFILDTGSSLVWFPCTSRYVCSKCNFPNIDSTKIPRFMPRNSSSSKIVGCKSPKCAWIFGSDVQCSKTCPDYGIQYGLGATAGFLLLENLDFPEKIFTNFLVGCSIFSVHQPAGVAGFGRGPQSLPSQLGLKRFSYCLLSRKFDDTPQSSDLVLSSGSSGDRKTDGLSYTSFLKNPAGKNPGFLEYYYINLRKITVGDMKVKIPYKFLVPDSDGNGGTVVDSGSTFTFMEKAIFDLVAREFEKQMANYKRAKHVETQSGFTPCFDISKEKTVNFPEFVFQFKGGANMKLPLANYFLLEGNSVACLAILTDNVAGGPAIIFGGFQQQNFYVEYDLENERFGFKPQSCEKSA